LKPERKPLAFSAWSVEREGSLCLGVYVQKLDSHMVNVFCVVIVVKKCTVLS